MLDDTGAAATWTLGLAPKADAASRKAALGDGYKASESGISELRYHTRLRHAFLGARIDGTQRNRSNGRERTTVAGGSLLSAVLKWDLNEGVATFGHEAGGPLLEPTRPSTKRFRPSCLSPATPRKGL